MPDKSLQGSKLEAAINIAQKAELFTIIRWRRREIYARRAIL